MRDIGKYGKIKRENDSWKYRDRNKKIERMGKMDKKEERKIGR